MRSRVLCGLLRGESGLTTIEYAVATSLLAIAVAMAFAGLGDSIGEFVARLVELLP